MTPFAKMLRIKRRERDLRQIDVADLLGITLRQYMNYEKDHLPPHEQVIKLNNLFSYPFHLTIYGNTAKRKRINNK